ncbi:MAG TPA: alpha-hydroxy-acid oxidizing protein [Candidatus Acidoferrum sp.]|jgi:isopentenyl diphosphate isomerase/L-lactate dehydrogenase-like FMN-dependent dehydrogenase|nr:alpha-hydroxy-acid oxidizing protein [Candidatus Acidoferrum sp.]
MKTRRKFLKMLSASPRLGATAVGMGRPHAWGLGAFGQAGVEAVLDILRRELRTVMRQAGTTSLDQINRNCVIPHFF